MGRSLVCPVNVSEGRRIAVLDQLASAAGSALLDLHHDPHHNRAVLTIGASDATGTETAVRRVAELAVTLLDVRRHQGVHPRLGVVDVVPFVPVDESGAPAGPGDDLAVAIAARDRFAAWAAQALRLPCFVYGPERTLPDVRRRAFDGLQPDVGPQSRHPSAGACAVGARAALVAFNVWLDSSDVAIARSIAAAIRGPAVRALGLDVGGQAQVSCNLIDPFSTGPAAVLQQVSARAVQAGVGVDRAELVGLAPLAVVEALEPATRARCDLDRDRTFEARLARARAR